MAENSLSSPIFAGRYRFQPVGTDWDRGRSGLTHLVFDIQKERLGVIKRAGIRTQQQVVEGLKNEVAALLDLKGQNVPEVYDTGEAGYGSNNYFYVVTEYIDGIRVEKNLETLSSLEGVEILSQFFNLLAKAHKLGIVNGDVDLKHLFWRRDKKQLVVIDWGNAKLNQKRETDFSYDLARSAEIIYSLTTRKGNPSATGPIVLPNDSTLPPGLTSLPSEFRKLCGWAPRIPTDGAISPHTAQELLEVANEWQRTIKNAKSPPAKRQASLRLILILGFILIVALFIGFSPNSPIYPVIHSKTSTPSITISDTFSPTAVETITPIKTQPPTVTETLTTQTLQPTSTKFIIIPPPRTYIEITPVFDKTSFPENCWTGETTSSLAITSQEGFSRRSDHYWRFGIGKERATDALQVDFSACFANNKIAAVGLNAWVSRLELERNSPNIPGSTDPGKEFGIFIENANGQRREYTIWIDKSEAMHLRVRENNQIISDTHILIIEDDILKIKGVFPRLYAEFPIQVFFEINNQGLDILYMLQGPIQLAVPSKNIDPDQMIRVNNVYSTLGTIEKFGLIGYGGETQIVVWPLSFYGE